MRSNALWIVVVLVALLAVACGRQPTVPSRERSPEERASDYRVELLFEHDGCKVYRFYDRRAGEYVWFAKCDGQSSSGWTNATSRFNPATKTTVTERQPVIVVTR